MFAICLCEDGMTRLYVVLEDLPSSYVNRTAARLSRDFKKAFCMQSCLCEDRCGGRLQPELR